MNMKLYMTEIWFVSFNFRQWGMTAPRIVPEQNGQIINLSISFSWVMMNRASLCIRRFKFIDERVERYHSTGKKKGAGVGIVFDST